MATILIFWNRIHGEVLQQILLEVTFSTDSKRHTAMFERRKPDSNSLGNKSGDLLILHIMESPMPFQKPDIHSDSS